MIHYNQWSRHSTTIWSDSATVYDPRHNRLWYTLRPSVIILQPSLMVLSTTIYGPLYNHLWSTLHHSTTIYGPLYNHLWFTLQPSLIHPTTIDNLLYNHLQKSTKTFSDATRPTKLKTGRYLCRLYCAIVIFRHTRWKKIAFGGEPLKKGKSYRSFSTFIPARSFN